MDGFAALVTHAVVAGLIWIGPPDLRIQVVEGGEVIRIPSVRRTEGYALMLPEPISQIHLAYYERILGLEGDQLEIVREFYHTYLRDWATTLQALPDLIDWSRKAAGQRGSTLPDRAQAYDEMLNERLELVDQLVGIDDVFLVDLFSLATDDDQSAERVRVLQRERQRARADVFDSSVSLASIDLIDHVLPLFKDLRAIPDELWRILGEYGREITPLFERRAATRVDLMRESQKGFQRVQVDGRNRSDPVIAAELDAISERRRAISRQMFDEDKDIQRINRRHFGLLASQLPAKERRRFEVSVRLEEYRMIHPDPFDPLPVVEEVEGLEGLSEDEAQALTMIRSTSVATYESACRAMEKRFEAWQDEVEPEMSYATGDRQSYREDMLELHERRKAAGIAAIGALKQTFSPERLEDIASLAAFDEFVKEHGDRPWNPPG